jgi:alkylated DNA repair dioxygenase AlkB
VTEGVATRFIPAFLAREEADELKDWLLGSVEWHVEHFQIFGKRLQVPRRLAWFGDPGVSYRYTATEHIADGWPQRLLQVKRRIEQYTTEQFNFLLLNRYDHGQHHMGWHRDDEAGCSPLIASLNVGATRRFRLSSLTDEVTDVYPLGHGDLLLFDGYQRHMLAKTRRAVAPRINLTFRQVLA